MAALGIGPLLPGRAWAAEGRPFRPGVLKRLCRGSVCYREPVSLQAELRDFWKVHPRFGFFREGARLILGARDQRIAKQVISELRCHSGKGQGQACPVTPAAVCAGPPGACFFDVTEVAAAQILDRHHVKAKSNGRNCYNFCLSHRLLSGTYKVSYTAVRELLTAPFAKRVKRADRLRPGDVIILEGKGLTKSDPWAIHGAIFISDNLVLSKNGDGRANRYRLMDLKEMIALYEEPDAWAKVYRVAPLEQLLKDHGARLPVKLRRDLQTVQRLEGVTDRYELDRGQAPLSAAGIATRKRLYRKMNRTAWKLWRENSDRYFELDQSSKPAAQRRELSDQEHLEYKFLNLLMTKLGALNALLPPSGD